MIEANENLQGKPVDTFPCVFCGGSDFSPLFSAPAFDTPTTYFHLVLCRACGLVRTEPLYNPDELARYYTLSYYGGGDEKFSPFVEALTRLSSDWRAHSVLYRMKKDRLISVNKPFKILDIGCGRGNLLKSLKRLGCDCHGIEREEFQLSSYPQDIHLYRKNLEDIPFDAGSFDAVVIWHVLEHVDNPVSTIREASRILKSGGLLAIAVPNFGSLQASIFGKSWFHLDLPRHRYHFNPDTLLRILSKNGFETITYHTFSIEQNPFGFIQSFLNEISSPEKTNAFYSLLKKTRNTSSVSKIRLILWITISLLIFPFAFFEYLLSGMLGKGATFVVYTRKC